MDATGGVVGAEKAGDTWDVLAKRVQEFLKSWDQRANRRNWPNSCPTARRLCATRAAGID